MDLAAVLLTADAGLVLLAAYFTIVSFHEKEPRAPWVGAIATVLLAGVGLLIVAVPAVRTAIGVIFGALLAFGSALLIPTRGNLRALQGAAGHVVGEAARFDERDEVFARNRSLPPGSEVYRRYYAEHPEREARDGARRSKGETVGRMGSIDNGHRPNVAMIQACFEMPVVFGKLAEALPPAGSVPEPLDPARAATIVKGLARRIGAGLVGVCRVNPAWAYSHRGEIFYGNWDDWGREIPEPLPFAVVIATEMDHGNVGAGPHTPALFESAFNYGQGAFITTILSRWFAAIGLSRRGPAQPTLRPQHGAPGDRCGPGGVEPFRLPDCGQTRVPGAAVRGNHRHAACGRPADRSWSRRVLPKVPEVCRILPLKIDSGRRKDRGERDREVEARCGELLRLLGQGRDRLLGLHGGLPLQPAESRDPSSGAPDDPSLVSGAGVLPHIDNFVYGKRWKPRPAREWIAFPASVKH